MLKGKGRTVVERNLMKFNSKCLPWQQHCSIRRSYETAASAVTERRAETGAVRRRINSGQRSVNWFYATAGMGMRRRFAVHARKAGQDEQIKRKYAAKPLHKTKVIKKVVNSCIGYCVSLFAAKADVTCSSGFLFLFNR